MTDLPRSGWSRDVAFEAQFRRRLGEAAEIWRVHKGDREWTVTLRGDTVFATLTVGDGMPEPLAGATARAMLAAARA